MRLQVGTDVGGTFTDLWALTDEGRQIVVKSPSTRDIVSGVLVKPDWKEAAYCVVNFPTCRLLPTPRSWMAVIRCRSGADELVQTMRW